ncbi:MAG: hypothetical protein HOC70_14625 [Gammaproteobacteria bacterium]|jgi:hypothetical protein|nr:hypothetical protein [Gammaproteobacteria bacterium]MBT4494474.1 hypothetical protein [Gammaproteobacteria bacterium]MBT7370017.1 hypothetical protein [Gammaproteobacteria bacterium]
MRVGLWILGIILGIFLVFGIIQTAASERIEVVQLHTLDDNRETITTRLWIVDDEGFAYLRGDEGSGWVTRLMNGNEFQLSRGDFTKTYKHTLRPDKVDTINRLMQEKYTWGDSFFAIVVGEREHALPIELHPVE